MPSYIVTDATSIPDAEGLEPKLRGVGETIVLSLERAAPFLLAGKIVKTGDSATATDPPTQALSLAEKVEALRLTVNGKAPQGAVDAVNAAIVALDTALGQVKGPDDLVQAGNAVGDELAALSQAVGGIKTPSQLASPGNAIGDALLGVSSSQTSFNPDGSITEVINGVTVTTTFPPDGRIVKTYGAPISKVMTTSFGTDGSITKTVTP